MSKIKKLLVFLAYLFVIQNTYAALPIEIEVKVLGKDVIFILYRDKEQVIDFTRKGNVVFANINIPTAFKLINSDQFNQYASNIKLTNSNQTITFSVNGDLEYQSVISGEQLDAIKFRSIKKKEEDLSTLSSAKNDPGSITYKHQGSNHILEFNIGNDNSKLATFFRGKYLWVVFDQKKVFSFKENSIFNKFDIVPSQDSTVLRIKIKDEYNNARTEKVKSGWNIIVSKQDNKKWNTEHIVTPQFLDNQEGFLISGNFKDYKVIAFEDPELKDIVSTVPVIIPGLRVDNRLDSIEFSLLKSIQGIAMIINSDDILVEGQNNALKVSSNTSLPENASTESNIVASAINEYIKLPTILPYLNKNLDILDFNEQRSRLINEATLAEDSSEKFNKNLALAKFFFIHEWYQESLDSLLIAKQFSEDEYKSNLQARFLTAVNYTMVERYDDAKEEYDNLLSYHDIKRISEIDLWNKYNDYCLGLNPGNIGFLNNLTRTINLYSDDKYWSLAFVEIELALLANDLKLAERLFKEIKRPPEGKYANSLNFYRANYYRKKKQLNLAKQFYKDLSVKEDDLFNSTRAEFDLVKLSLSEKEISLSEAIERLEKLRFSWRGDQLEYQILLQLSNYYRDNNDVMNALRVYQYIQTAFNNKVSNFYITSEMSRIFNEVCLPGGLGEEMDDFTVVALFYEFKELNPIGEQGDDVILSIVKRLIRLDLLDNAADLLRHQIKYRLQGEKRVINADNLAVILMIDNKPNEAMIVLDDTDRDNFNFNEHQYRVRLRAKALIYLEKYDEALAYLKDDLSEDAEIIRREALFQAKRWSDYADLVKADFDGTIEKVGSDNAAVQDVLRLAISYYLLNSYDQLKVISEAIGNKNILLKNTIDLLSTSSEAIDYKNLDKSLNIDQMKILLDKYKQQFLDK